jgi:hypothetical protein
MDFTCFTLTGWPQLVAFANAITSCYDTNDPRAGLAGRERGGLRWAGMRRGGLRPGGVHGWRPHRGGLLPDSLVRDVPGRLARKTPSPQPTSTNFGRAVVVL